jgi:SHS2 domain-containing protein
LETKKAELDRLAANLQKAFDDVATRGKATIEREETARKILFEEILTMIQNSKPRDLAVNIPAPQMDDLLTERGISELLVYASEVSIALNSPP